MGLIKTQLMSKKYRTIVLQQRLKMVFGIIRRLLITKQLDQSLDPIEKLNETGWNHTILKLTHMRQFCFLPATFCSTLYIGAVKDAVFGTRLVFNVDTMEYDTGG